jgi:UPF0716 family protein affecting phage T7 exclusion
LPRIRKFLCLPAAQRHPLLQAVLLLGAIRLGLWLLPFRTLQRLLARLAQAPTASPEAGAAAISGVVWAVAGASRYVPGATCLTQALGARVLLARCGQQTQLRLGVTRSAAGQFQAHAWVEWQGRVVLGGADAPRRYTPLPPLEREHR